MILYFIKKTIVTLCLNLAIILLGLFSFKDIANEFIPAIEVPAVAVVFPTTVLKREQIVRDLLAPIERVLMATGDVEHIESRLESGQTLLIAHYKWSLRPEECLQRARQVVGGMQRPVGILSPVFVLHRPALSPILRVVFHSQNDTSPLPIARLTSIAQETARGIERVGGVSQVRLEGAAPKAGFIEVDEKRSVVHGITLSGILSSASNLWGFRHLFKSDLDNNSSLVQIKLDSLAALSDMPVINNAGRGIPLRWIANVREATADPRVFFGKGEAALILEVIKAPGADALSIADASMAMINKAQAGFSGVKTTVIYDEAQKIRTAQDGVLSNFATGIMLNSIILIFFLGSISGCVIASCVFPTAIFGTLIVMKMLGISFNIFSLNGFSLAAGMITDSSTVVLEAILSRFQKGEGLVDSCDKGTQDVGTGVFTGALTSSAVMLPICLQTGVSSKLFSDLAVTMITANFLCLIGVFTLVPWVSSKLIKPDKKQTALVATLFKNSSAFVKVVSGFSKNIFDRSIASRKVRIGLPLAISTLSFGSLLFVPPSELLPMVKSNTYAVTIPVKRSNLDDKGESYQKMLTKTLGEGDGVEWTLTSRNSDMLSATVMMKEGGSIYPVLNSVSKTLQMPLKKVLSFPLGPTPPTEPMNYSGYFFLDQSILQKARDKIVTEFCSSKGVVDCTTHDHYSYPEIVLKNLPLNMARSGLNPLNNAIEGNLHLQELDLASMANLSFSTPVYLKSQNDEMLIDNPMLFGKKGIQISKYGTFYDHEFDKTHSTAFRYDLNTYEPVYFRLNKITIGQAVRAMSGIAKKHEVIDTKVKGMGLIKNMKETFKKMGLALLIAGILIFLILLWQFKSVIQTLIIMYSIPLAVGGAILGLVLMRETMNAGVIVGFVLLIGIVVNNGILLLESMNQLLEQGVKLVDAIQAAVTSRTRPILMTAFGTIFGMLPTLVFESEGQELYRGMAIVNIFGLAFGSFLTLVITPILTRNFLEKGLERRPA